MGDVNRESLRVRLAKMFLSEEDQENLPRFKELKEQLIEIDKQRRELETRLGGNDTQARFYFAEAMVALWRGDYEKANNRLNMLPEVIENRRKGKNKTIYVPNIVDQEVLGILTPRVIYFDLADEQKLAYASATQTLRAAGYRVLDIIDRIPSKILSEYVAAPTGEEYRAEHPDDHSTLQDMLRYCVETSEVLVRRNLGFTTLPYEVGDKLAASLAKGGVPLEEGAKALVSSLDARHRSKLTERYVPFVDRNISNLFIDYDDDGGRVFIAHDFETLPYMTLHGHNLADMVHKLNPLLPHKDEEEQIRRFCSAHGITDTRDFRIDVLVRSLRIAGQYMSEYPEVERRVAENFELLAGVQLASYTLGGIVDASNRSSESILRRLS